MVNHLPTLLYMRDNPSLLSTMYILQDLRSNMDRAENIKEGIARKLNKSKSDLEEKDGKIAV